MLSGLYGHGQSRDAATSPHSGEYGAADLMTAVQVAYPHLSWPGHDGPTHVASDTISSDIHDSHHGDPIMPVPMQPQRSADRAVMQQRGDDRDTPGGRPSGARPIGPADRGPGGMHMHMQMMESGGGAGEAHRHATGTRGTRRSLFLSLCLSFNLFLLRCVSCDVRSGHTNISLTV